MSKLSLIDDTAVTNSIISAVASGVPVHTALMAAGVSYHTARNWRAIAENASSWPDGTPVDPTTRQKICDLFSRIALAKQEWVRTAAANIAKAGFVPDKFGRPDWRAHAWLLENSPDTRVDWHPHREMTVDQHVTLHPAVREIRQLSDEQLLERVEQLPALLTEPTATSTDESS